MQCISPIPEFTQRRYLDSMLSNEPIDFEGKLERESPWSVFNDDEAQDTGSEKDVSFSLVQVTVNASPSIVMIKKA